LLEFFWSLPGGEKGKEEGREEGERERKKEERGIRGFIIAYKHVNLIYYVYKVLLCVRGLSLQHTSLIIPEHKYQIQGVYAELLPVYDIY